MAQGNFDHQNDRIRQIDCEFNRIFCVEDEPVPISLIRSATKMIVCSYPEHLSRTLAVAALMRAVELLKEATR